MSDSTSRPLCIALVSSNGSWGGSEELWSRVADELADGGHLVTVYKGSDPEAEPVLRRLRERGVRVRDLHRVPLLPRRWCWKLRASRILSHAIPLARLAIGLLLSRRPDLIVISQGGNHDGVFLGELCRRKALRYALISHKASPVYWPSDLRREVMRRVFAGAEACYFVSEDNRSLTEQQLAMSLTRASVVRNPFLVPWDAAFGWPDSSGGFRLACVGRFNPLDKGQDLVLQVLAADRWRKRPVTVSFFGSGDKRNGLEGMARHLGLQNVFFEGFEPDVKAIWKGHHALLLGSRAEGMPLVLVEAMLAGRVPIVTAVGGNGELVEDGITGFLARSASVDALDDALERAWSRREEWDAIGEAASRSIREVIPRDPAKVMAARLLQLVSAPEIGRRSTESRDQTEEK